MRMTLTAFRGFALLAIGGGVVFAPAPVSAQQVDSARAGVKTAPPPLTPAEQQARATAATGKAPARATTGPPISPGRAFFYSLLVPGLGQAKLDRPVAGALYGTLELVSIAMLQKTWFDEREAQRFMNDSIPLSYKVDPSGVAVLDSLGRPVVDQYAFNRFGGTLRVARRANAEDWVALLIFNHLFSGADAYVAAHLWDLPANVAVRWLPGGPMVNAAVHFRW
jgi:hypothetical protein